MQVSSNLKWEFSVLSEKNIYFRDHRAKITFCTHDRNATIHTHAIFFDETSSEGGELPHCIKERGKMVQLIRKPDPKTIHARLIKGNRRRPHTTHPRTNQGTSSDPDTRVPRPKTIRNTSYPTKPTPATSRALTQQDGCSRKTLRPRLTIDL
jgi:hypothetical protein